MKYCTNCGQQIDEKAVVCIHCGAATDNSILNTNTTDNGGFGWGALGCCIPLVGLILFLVWKDQKPKTSKAAGIGALIGVGSIVLFYILIIVFGIAVANSNPYYY